MAEITRLDQITAANDAEIDAGTLNDFAPILNFGVANTPTQKTGRLTTWARFLRLLRRAGLWQPEALTAAASFNLAAADSGRQLILNAATAQAVTLSNLGAVRLYVINSGTAPWSFAGAATMLGPSVLMPGQSAWLEGRAGNIWRLHGSGLASDQAILEMYAGIFNKGIPDIGTPSLASFPGFPYISATRTITWPNGAAGVITITSVNARFASEASWTVTHVLGGVTKTITQPPLTFNEPYGIPTMPAPTIA